MFCGLIPCSFKTAESVPTLHGTNDGFLSIKTVAVLDCLGSHEIPELSQSSVHNAAASESPRDSPNPNIQPHVCEQSRRHFDVSVQVGLMKIMLVTSVLGNGPTRQPAHHSANTTGALFPILMAPRVELQNIEQLRREGINVLSGAVIIDHLVEVIHLARGGCMSPSLYNLIICAAFFTGVFLCDLVVTWLSPVLKLPARLLIPVWGLVLGSWSFLRGLWSKLKPSSWFAPEATRAPPIVEGDRQLSDVLALEASAFLHSVLLGVNLILFGDNSLHTYFTVIVFHQFIEGIELGAFVDSSGQNGEDLSMRRKVGHALAFALMAPLGMTVGVVIKFFYSGSNSSIEVSTDLLRGLVAGVLAWLVLSRCESSGDWWDMKRLVSGSPLRTVIGLLVLVIGMAWRSVLGKVLQWVVDSPYWRRDTGASFWARGLMGR
ncbi:hypothetical protein B0T26DRAFT_96297 [Lasiosphaeria miniovina]|uniref:Uncharacterized protein n=1 Tax=Lasiosphaeria miniovina TaxID=1954250 RepID=A0AA40BJ10_9PEZI|nr:uncharacterized protein B0T26DRAFT_96297 [Lasiosphaeria miniovina]KAK0735129.1 hypothetical protein B0T26DRAFT_96297 [Lasiosphaeria miniovina]